jgi:hypothetical protein
MDGGLMDEYLRTVLIPKLRTVLKEIAETRERLLAGRCWTCGEWLGDYGLCITQGCNEQETQS